MDVEPGFPPAPPEGVEQGLPGLGGSAVVRTVGLQVVPDDGGMAHRSVSGDNMVQGGHLSGDSPPFVHVDHGRVGDECAAALREAAEAVVAGIEAGELDATPADGPGNTTLNLELVDGRTLQVHWPFRGEPTDPRLRALLALIAEIDCGGW